MEYLFDKWEIIFADFEEKYPQLVETVNRWVPYSSYEIIIETNDGSIYIYDHELNEVRGYCENLEYFERDISEEETRKKFAYRLRSRLKKMGMTYDDLSNVTGISRVTISNYATGKATPSMYNMSKIARSLKCTTQTLSGN